MKGMTVIELIATLVILSILAVYAQSRFSFGSYDNMVAAREVIQAIRYAQFQSMYHTDLSNYEVNINFGGNTLSVTRGGVAIPDPVNTNQNFVRSFPGINITPSPGGRITFDRRGQPTCNNGLVCAGADLVITVSGVAVTMESFTGFVR